MFKMLPINTYKEYINNPTCLQDVSGRPITNMGTFLISLKVGCGTYQIPIVRVPDNLDFPKGILLGWDAMSILGLGIDCRNQQVQIKHESLPLQDDSNQFIKYINNINRINISSKSPIKIRVRFTQTITPKSWSVINVNAWNAKEKPLVFTPYNHFRENLSESLISVKSNGLTVLYIQNRTNLPLKLEKGTIIGKAMEIDIAEINPLGYENVSKIWGTNNSRPLDQIIAELDPYVTYEGEYRESLLKVLASYRDVIALPEESLGLTHLTELSLKLMEGAKPIALVPYKIPHSKQDLLNNEIEKLLEQGLIKPTTSAWAFPVVLIAKSDGGIRLCVDYRKLNSITETDNYPLPVIEDILMDLGKSKIFSQIDLAQAFHQVPLSKETAPMTAFRTRKGHFEYTVAPFGLKQMPALFQRLMNQIFNVKETRNNVSTYLDDLLIHSNSIHDHLEHLRKVLHKLREANLKIKLKKCNFLQPKVHYLGYELSSEGLKPQWGKVEAISKFPHPKNADAVRSFLGMCGYYRCYIPQFSSIAKPLTELLKKEIKFEWTSQCEHSFKKLQEYLTNHPVLVYPDYSKPFTIETDASQTGIGAILSQKDTNTGKYRPIAYASRLVKGAEKNYSATDLEALAVVWALKKFRYVIYGYEIIVYTDHKPLTSIFSGKLSTGRLARWALTIQEYGIKILYKEGVLNKGPDALSRYPLTQENSQYEKEMESVGHIRKILHRQSAWSIKELIRNQNEDIIFGPIYSYLENKIKIKDIKIPKGLTLERFKLHNNILHYQEDGQGTRKGRTILKVVVPNKLVPKLLCLYHDLPSAGHRGRTQTMTRIGRQYLVLNLSTEIRKHLDQCEPCLEHRSGRNTKVPLHYYPIEAKPFGTVHMDILGPLPTTQRGMKYIIVYVDRFTRYTIIDSLRDRTTQSVAESLLRSVIKEHTTPSVLISDNALEFLSKVMEDLCALFHINKKEITAYVPAANGLAEAANKRILNALKVAVNKSGTNWDKLIPHIQIALNCAFHPAIGDTPHYLLYMRDKRLPFENESEPSEELTLGEYVENYRKYQKISFSAVQKCLSKEQERYTTNYNKTAREIPVKVGDRVYIKTRPPINQFSKFYPKFEGPYRILRNLGKHRYKVVDLKTLKERKVYGNAIKIVAETAVTKAMNERVRLPYPHLEVESNCGFESDDSEEEDYLLINVPSFPSTCNPEENETDNPERLEHSIDSTPQANLKEITPETEVIEPPFSTPELTPNKNGYHLRPRPRPLKFFDAIPGVSRKNK